MSMKQKRLGGGARDSPTKDRYAGKRQQQQSGRGGRRQKAGSRDVSPVPPTWPQPSAPSSPAHPPPLTPHQIALQQQHVLDSITKTPANELILQIKKLTFPSSCTFVLTLLERYVKAHLSNDTMLKISLPKKGSLLILFTYFILCRPVSVKVTGKKNKVDLQPQPYSPLEELQVMVSVLNKIEEQKSIEQQFCIFEALFGACEETIKTGARAAGTFFERVVCLAVNLQSCATLNCIALWMQAHPSEALSLSHSLYSCFCEHLPNASEPLRQLASLSPLLAQQLTISYTTLYPFHIVGTPVPGVDSAHLQPPRQLLAIVSNWIESTPQFLYTTQLIDKKTDLPSFHTASKTPRLPASPLAGLIQWCVLASCDHTTHTSKESCQEGTRNSQPSKEMETKSPETASTDKKESMKSEDEDGVDFRTLIAKLHANLLSVILSDSQSFPRETLTSDHVAVTVAALLGLSNYKPTQLKKRGKGEEREDRDENKGLDESVERLAQFLQISLSTGLLALSSDNLSSMASTLPINKLLTLVIAHHSARR